MSKARPSFGSQDRQERLATLRTLGLLSPLGCQAGPCEAGATRAAGPSLRKGGGSPVGRAPGGTKSAKQTTRPGRVGRGRGPASVLSGTQESLWCRSGMSPPLPTGGRAPGLPPPSLTGRGAPLVGPCFAGAAWHPLGARRGAGSPMPHRGTLSAKQTTRGARQWERVRSLPSEGQGLTRYASRKGGYRDLKGGVRNRNPHSPRSMLSPAEGGGTSRSRLPPPPFGGGGGGTCRYRGPAP